MFPQIRNPWVKDVKMSASKEIYKKDFMSIESTLNVSKVSTFKVSNNFWRIKCQNLVEIMLHYHSV